MDPSFGDLTHTPLPRRKEVDSGRETATLLLEECVCDARGQTSRVEDVVGSGTEWGPRG